MGRRMRGLGAARCRTWWVGLIALGAVACVEPVVAQDAGERMDGGVSGGGADAGLLDAGNADAGGFDAGPTDAGRSDGGTADGGVDGGAVDGGFDGGSDGGADAGSADAGRADAGGQCPATLVLGPGDHSRTVSVGGLSRTYLVHVPPRAPTAPMPAVFDFHPLGVTAATWKTSTPWPAVADREGFVLVWPQGVGDSWNVGRCCNPALDAGVDDVAFFRAVLAEVLRDGCVDPARVYATGCSNGGGMTYKLACDAADAIAAVAPVDFDCITGATNSPSCGGCRPSRAISTCQFRGVLDPLVPYFGGPTTVVAGLSFPGASANLATWGGLNGCTGAPSALPNRSSCQGYPSCDAGAETVLCTVALGTHCVDYASFGTADIAWELFSRHRLP